MILGRGVVSPVGEIHYVGVDGEEGAAGILGSGTGDGLVYVDVGDEADGAGADVGDVDEGLGEKFSLDAEAPLHDFGGLEVVVPDVWAAGGELDGVFGVEGDGGRDAVGESAGRGSVLVGGDDLREEEGEVFIELPSALPGFDEGDAEAAAEDGFAVFREHIGESGAGGVVIQVELAEAALGSAAGGDFEFGGIEVEVGPAVVDFVGRGLDIVAEAGVDGEAGVDAPGVIDEGAHVPEAHAEGADEDIAVDGAGGAEGEIGEGGGGGGGIDLAGELAVEGEVAAGGEGGEAVEAMADINAADFEGVVAASPGHHVFVLKRGGATYFGVSGVIAEAGEAGDGDGREAS